MGDVMNATDVVDLFTEMSYCQSAIVCLDGDLLALN